MTVKDLLEKNCNDVKSFEAISVHQIDFSMDVLDSQTFLLSDLHEYANNYKNICEWVIYHYGRFWVKQYKISIGENLKFTFQIWV